jgi:hypothetical protein
MSHPDPGHPAEANGTYPHELRVHNSASTGTGIEISGTGTRQYQEWHHAAPLSRRARRARRSSPTRPASPDASR